MSIVRIATFYIECVYRGNGGDDGSWYYEFNEP